VILFGTLAFLFMPFRSVPPESGDIGSHERNRRAAEWLSSINVRITVSTEQSGHVEIAAGDPLPAERFWITGADLTRQQKVRDADLARLRNLSHLVTLGLGFTNIGDDGLLRLANLPALENLFFVETQVSDRGLEALRRFPKLTTLYLSGTRISDAGLEHVGACQRLNELALVGCNISDAGLARLHGLTNLKTLDLHNTKVTFEGIADLEAAIPNCSIQSNVEADDATSKSEQNRSPSPSNFPN
jgi:hypothetical protein